MNTQDLFKTMCTITNAHAGLIRGAQVIWVNEDEDSFITGERRLALSESDPGDQRIVEQHPNPIIALTPQEPPQDAQGNHDERAAFEAWAKSAHMRTDRWAVNPELYDDEDTISAWQGWQARAVVTGA